MANPFLNDTLKVAVAQICQTIGFQGIFSTPADVLRDVLHRYLTEVCRVTHRYSEHFGRTEPNLDDLGLAFQDLGVNVTDLEEYINNVDSPSFPHQVPSVPIRRASNLNFLKPGSREILSRPIHIHEHLPPMYPEKEDEVDVKLENDGSSNMEDGITPIESPLTPSKRPLESDNLSPLKKTKYFQEEEGQPVREILSVMMTTSGFISSAREGKLPEAAMPNIPMAPVRTTTPTINSPASGKKKLERIIRQKNSQGGSSSGGTGSKAGSSGSGKKNNSSRAKNNPSGQGIKTPGSNSNKDKDGVVGGLNIPKAKPGSLPPSKALPPTLNPVGPVTPGTPQQMPPKLKIPPKIKVPKLSKTPKSEGKITPLTSVSTPKPKESSKDPEQKKVKKDKEKKNKDGKEKKDKEKKEKSGKEKSGKEKKEGKKKDKESKKIKKEKKVQDKEKAEEAERERELILKLASSAAVSITSIPPPTKILQADNSDKLEVKSKLSIFQKKKKHKGGDIEGDLDKDPNMSRDSSPDLMIDENPNHVGSSSGQWKLMDDEAPSFREAPIRRLDLPPDEPSSSPVDAKLHQFPDNLSPPGTPTTPRTPEIPHTTKNKNSEKRKNKDKTNKDKTNKDKTNKEKKKKDKTKSQKIVNFNSPSHQSASESETPDRPKTPEAGGVSQNDPSAAPFSLNPFPSAPGFIPPFSGFPLFGMGTFGAPSIRPPMPDLRLSSHSFVPSHHSTKRPLEDESVMDDIDNMDRPLTPRHDREASPLPLQVLTGDPGRSPQSSGLLSPSGSIPRPRTPVLMSPQPLMKQKPDKGEKSEKKKEHKKEKKEKDKDKVKKKKDKKDKDKDKDKDKVEKKKDKDKLKQEKKEKKKGKKDKGEAGSMKLTMKFSGGAPPVRSPPATSLPTQQQQKQEPQQQQQQQQLLQQQQQQHHEVTPKLVIKPVIKHEEPPVPSIQPTTFDKQPGSPEIAKFSALITRPPKASKQPKVVEVQSVPALKIKELSAAKGSPSSKKEMKEASKTKEITSLKIKPLVQPPKMSSPKVANEKKSPSNKKGKEKKEKKEKKSKEGLGNLGEVSSVTVTPIAPAEIAVIAPAPTPTPTPTPTPKPAPAPAPNPPQKKETSHPSHPSQQQQQPQQQQQQQQSTGLLTETVGPIGHFVDDQGNEVWICPTCGKQDDGSPMIGCDTCDDWYHWVCVGIQVPPSEDSNWYCPRCLSQHKQKGAITDKKKRGRKKK